MHTPTIGQVVTRKDHGGEQETVKAACAIKDKGNWYCVTCGHICSQFGKGSAEDCDGRHHTMAWACFEHGLEVP